MHKMRARIEEKEDKVRRAPRFRLISFLLFTRVTLRALYSQISGLSSSSMANIPGLPIQIFIPRIALMKQPRSSGRMNDELHSRSFYLRSYIRREIAERKQEEGHTEWCLTNWETGLQLNPLCAMSRFEFGLVRQVSDSFCRDALSHQTRLINDHLSVSPSLFLRNHKHDFSPFFLWPAKFREKYTNFEHKRVEWRKWGFL